MMRLSGLLQYPWNVSESSIFSDFLPPRQHVRHRGGVRGQLSKWTKNLIARVYDMSGTGEGMCDPNGRFSGIADQYFAPNLRMRRTGWTFSHCTHTEVRRLFEFLNPILHPERPGRISLTVAITVVASLEGRVLIDWALVLHDVIHKLVAILPRIPPFSYVSPYLFHVYDHSGCLSLIKSIRWADACRRYQHGPKTEPEPTAVPRSDAELVEALSIILDCDREELIQTAKKLKKHESTGFQGRNTPMDPSHEAEGHTGPSFQPGNCVDSTIEEEGTHNFATDEAEDYVGATDEPDQIGATEKAEDIGGATDEAEEIVGATDEPDQNGATKMDTNMVGATEELNYNVVDGQSHEADVSIEQAEIHVRGMGLETGGEVRDGSLVAQGAEDCDPIPVGSPDIEDLFSLSNSADNKVEFEAVHITETVDDTQVEFEAVHITETIDDTQAGHSTDSKCVKPQVESSSGEEKHMSSMSESDFDSDAASAEGRLSVLRLPWHDTVSQQSARPGEGSSSQHGRRGEAEEKAHMQTPIAAVPLKSWQSLKGVAKWSPVQWDWQFQHIINWHAEEGVPLVPPLPPIVVDGRPHSFVPTYVFNPTHYRQLLPVDRH